MADITWEPQSVADIATQLSRIGNDFRVAVSEAYKSFNSIGTNRNWVGANFNAIADNMFNPCISTFNAWAEYIQTTVPNTVYQIAQMQAQTGGGSVSVSLTPASEDIRPIEDTEVRSDGSQILEAEVVRNEVNNKLQTECDQANNVLKSYYSQFENLGTLDGNAAIQTIYNELQGILSKCERVLSSFQNEARDAVEKSVSKTEATNEDTVRMASEIQNIIG